MVAVGKTAPLGEGAVVVVSGGFFQLLDLILSRYFEKEKISLFNSSSGSL